MASEETEVSAIVREAMDTAIDLGATEQALLDVTTEVAFLFRTGIVEPLSFDREKMRRAMDLAIIGLLHERGLIP